MSKGKFGIIGAFTLGFGAGMTASKWWPVVREKLGPTGKDLMAKGLDAVDKAKDLFWEKSEKFADVIAEIKEEQETEKKTKKPKAPVGPVENN